MSSMTVWVSGVALKWLKSERKMENVTCTHSPQSRLSSGSTHCALSACCYTFTLVSLDTLSCKHVQLKRQRRGGRRAEGHEGFPRGDPGGSLTNTGQWGKVQPPGPTINKPPHWSDALSLAGERERVTADVSAQGRSVKCTWGAFTNRRAFKSGPC